MRNVSFSKKHECSLYSCVLRTALFSISIFPYGIELIVLVSIELILDAKHANVCSQRHFSNAVLMEIELVLSDIREVFPHRQELLQLVEIEAL